MGDFDEIIAKAVELKKEQPYRSHLTINRMLQDMYGTTVCRSTLYDHLRNAGATRLKSVSKGFNSISQLPF